MGASLPWPVYDANNRLLLKEGSVISSERQLESLLLRKVYRARNGSTPVAEPSQPLEDNASPFDHLDDLMRRVRGVLDMLAARRPDAADRVMRLAADLRSLYHRWPDTMLGAVHLCHEFEYVYCHPVHCGLLAEMVAEKLGYDEARRASLVAAALTQNVAMTKLQGVLERQSDPLSEAQRKAIQAHPRQSVQLLKALGVEDPVWLRAVGQHHEHSDGNGYPEGLKDPEIVEEAHVLGLTDRYAAMISARSYRAGLNAGEALKHFYMDRGREAEERLTLLFIHELGVYPPGSFVQLNTGETGIVVKRGKTSLEPVVAAYQAPRGAPYARPLRRDCASSNYEIRRACSPDGSIVLNLSQLWSV